MTGNGSKENPYLIGTAAELAAFRDLVNSGKQPGACGKLTADIDLNPGITFHSNGSYSGRTPAQWMPRGSNVTKYTGTFDGDGHTISGLYIDSSTNFQGLFGFVDKNGRIQSVGVVNSYVRSAYEIGSVCRRNEGTIENCYNAGTVSTEHNF